MPYPDANSHAITTPSTSLEARVNGLTGFIGNAHTGRATANGLTGQPMPPYGDWALVWTPVTFDGGDRLVNATNLGLAATFDTLTFAAAFKITNMSAVRNVLLATATGPDFPLIEIGNNGSISMALTDESTYGFDWVSVGGLVAEGQPYVLHVRAVGSTNTLQVWLNGVDISVGLTPATWAGTAAFARPAGWRIGSRTTAGVNPFIGQVGLIWFDAGQDITDPTKFYPAYDLGAQLANPGARPAVGFGGVQTAANWNAGTNLGDGTGTWTVTGAVT